LSCTFISREQFYFIFFDSKVIGHGKADNNLESLGYKIQGGKDYFGKTRIIRRNTSKTLSYTNGSVAFADNNDDDDYDDNDIMTAILQPCQHVHTFSARFA
jgi:hypothetical protein